MSTKCITSTVKNCTKQDDGERIVITLNTLVPVKDLKDWVDIHIQQMTLYGRLAHVENILEKKSFSCVPRITVIANDKLSGHLNR